MYGQKNRKRRNRKKKKKPQRVRAAPSESSGDREKDSKDSKDGKDTKDSGRARGSDSPAADVEIEYVTEEPEIYEPNFIFFKRIFEAFKVQGAVVLGGGPGRPGRPGRRLSTCLSPVRPLS